MNISLSLKAIMADQFHQFHDTIDQMSMNYLDFYVGIV